MPSPAVLVLVYHRPDTTKEVLEAIRLAKPSQLFISSDGPNPDRVSDHELVESVREICNKAKEWNPGVQLKFHDQNLGLRDHTISAIDWFFEHVPEGVMLEDDTLPHPDFFGYASEILERYRHDDRVWCFIGDNSSRIPVRGKASYTFSKYPLPSWGTGLWKRSWEKYDRDLTLWREMRGTRAVKRLWPRPLERRLNTERLNYLVDEEFHSWAYPWWFSVESQGGLAIIPRVNLISNVGLGRTDAAHPTVKSDRMGYPVGPILPLEHPKKVRADRRAEKVALNGLVFGAKRFKLSYQIKKRVRKKLRKGLQRVKNAFA